MASLILHVEGLPAAYVAAVSCHLEVYGYRLLAPAGTGRPAGILPAYAGLGRHTTVPV